MYADDVMLLTHTVVAMRHLLKICDTYAFDYDIKFNSSKSVAMRIGPRYNAVCLPFQLAGVRMKFYRVFNSIFSKSKTANSEIVTVKLAFHLFYMPRKL